MESEKKVNVHVISLPDSLAHWWHDLCVDLGIKSSICPATSPQSQAYFSVTTVCSDEDRVAAWQLFCEQEKLSPERFPIIDG